ncbi:MAG: CPBP family glutamic-type intramembrane protease [Pirellulaceae bacterium]
MVTATSTSPSSAAPYWELSSRPLVSLAFIAPLIAAYEVGVLTLGDGASRNGADVWLRSLLSLAGFGQYILLPVLVCGILLAWHHARRDPWQIDGRVVGTMWLESAVLALGLILVAQTLAGLAAGSSEPNPRLVAQPAGGTAWTARLIGYLGAGIYEELLFRMLLLPLAIALLQRAGLNRRPSAAMAIVATSLLFAAAHYQYDFTLLGMHFAAPRGDAFDWFSFLFRFAAGSVFALLFALRGFGIAAGTHALYDLLVLVA